ncbi:hypothetical protein M885DRAFT_620350, partial [Pelagophyceae sp. CCMP2097]
MVTANRASRCTRPSRAARSGPPRGCPSATRELARDSGRARPASTSKSVAPSTTRSWPPASSRPLRARRTSRGSTRRFPSQRSRSRSTWTLPQRWTPTTTTTKGAARSRPLGASSLRPTRLRAKGRAPSRRLRRGSRWPPASSRWSCAPCSRSQCAAARSETACATRRWPTTGIARQGAPAGSSSSTCCATARRARSSTSGETTTTSFNMNSQMPPASLGRALFGGLGGVRHGTSSVRPSVRTRVLDDERLRARRANCIVVRGRRRRPSCHVAAEFLPAIAPGLHARASGFLHE